MNNYRDLDPQGILSKRERTIEEKRKEGDQTRSVRKNKKELPKKLCSKTASLGSE